MCTVSVIRLADGFRLVCNRDEARLRAIALPPAVVHDDEGGRALMPRDPDSGGTWIAAADTGLVFAVLNLNAEGGPTPTSADRSRGEIIPQLLRCGTADDISAAMGRIDVSTFRPFRLLVANRDGVLEVRPDSRPVRHSLAAPLMFTSSGLGDHVVEVPRRALFEQLMANGADLVANQDRFHAHQWPSRLNVSVQMERADARTVSRTVVEIDDAGIRMDYWALEEGRPTTAPTSVEL